LPHVWPRTSTERRHVAAWYRSRIERELGTQHVPHWYGSATSALAAAVMMAVQRASGRSPPEVIIPAYACPDVVSAVRFVGATPVVADLLPDLPWLDPRSVADAMTRNTVAVLYVRFLGLPANDRALRGPVQDAGAVLIEDAAHTFPLARGVSSSADLVVFSFGRGKPVSVRRGGLLLQRIGVFPVGTRPPAPEVARAPSVAHWLECAFHNAGIRPLPYWLLTRVGRARADSIRYENLNSLEAFPSGLEEPLWNAIVRHRQPALWRQQCVEGLLGDLGPSLLDVARHARTFGAESCSSQSGCEHRLWRYPLLLPSEAERDRLFAGLWRAGLGASRMYRNVLSDLSGTARFVRASDTPNARAFAQRLLTLPLHADVSPAHYAAIREHLVRACRDRGALSECLLSR
jgi:dTDP-4-amino-4,6-dideoxygalactose transaminase